MRYLALACDYDGTLAHHGRVSASTVTALASLLARGRRLILVTGRELADLLAIFPEMSLFEWVVAENGAVLYCPATREEKVLAAAPPPSFVHALERRGVMPISVGRAIVATWQPHESTVLATIRDLGLELQVIFNKGAVMVLPTNVSKATGFAAALKQMGLSPHEAVGVGDAENDHAFLAMCECSAAVANALPAVKKTADIQTRGDHGDGVAELIDEIVTDDLRSFAGALTRHHLPLGTRRDGTAVKLPPYGPGILVAGSSDNARSLVAGTLTEQLGQRQYQFCVFDAGDIPHGRQAIRLGDNGHKPTGQQVIEILTKGESSVIVGLRGVRKSDRPSLVAGLLPQLVERRARTGRPHWIVLNDAHELLPAMTAPPISPPSDGLERCLFVTERPEQLPAAALASVGIVLAVADQPRVTLARVCEVLDAMPPPAEPDDLDASELLLWRRDANHRPYVVRIGSARQLAEPAPRPQP